MKLNKYVGLYYSDRKHVDLIDIFLFALRIVFTFFRIFLWYPFKSVKFENSWVECALKILKYNSLQYFLIFALCAV